MTAVLATKTSQPGFKPMLGALQRPLNVDALPVLTVDTYFVFDVVDEATKHNNVPQVTYYDGKFIAVWGQSSSEGVIGSQAVYSTSTDGMTWTAQQDIAGLPPAEFEFSPNGLWERDGDLLALYKSEEATPNPEGPGYYGDSLALRARRWDGSAWVEDQLILENCMLDCAPIKLRTGQWYATGRNTNFDTQMILGDIGNWQRIIVTPPEGILLNEATILPIADGDVISYEYRTEGATNNPRVLLRSFSFDDGVTISIPKRTNFSDGKSRRAVMRLSDGRYIMSSNAIDSGDISIRTHLMLSVSDDGYTYDRVYILRGEPTVPKYGVPGLERQGYQYPQFLEKDDDLWVIYSRNKEDIQISRVPLNGFE
jgi:hypothetical protein